MISMPELTHSLFHSTGLLLVPWIQDQNTCKTLIRDSQSPSAEERRTSVKFVLVSDNSWKHCSYEIRSSLSGDEKIFPWNVTPSQLVSYY